MRGKDRSKQREFLGEGIDMGGGARGSTKSNFFQDMIVRSNEEVLAGL